MKHEAVGWPTVKSWAAGLLRSVGVEERMRRLYWRIRMWRTIVNLELAGMSCFFHAVDQQMRSRLLRFSNEREHLAYLIDNIRPGEVIWDVGAYVGLYTMFAAAKTGLDGKVIAFEPERRARRRLKQNRNLNCAENTQILNCALSNEIGENTLYLSMDTPSSVGRLNTGAGRLKKMRICMETGDHLIASGAIPPPNLVKIDVEGAEYKTLVGMRDVLDHPGCRLILLEVHPAGLRQFGHGVDQLRCLLRDKGFTIHSMTSRGSEEHWRLHRS